jgi:PTH1 family peptidyl-tRNA hydrolase
LAESWKIIVGLGNPGDRYQNTRHNAGHMVLAVLAETKNFTDPSRFGKSLVTKGKIEGQKVILAWPQNFMNNSGQAVRELLGFYKEPLSNLLVVHDDMDLPAGRLKAVNGGGAGGHNGVISIVSELDDAFDRLRVGIGRPDRDKFQGDYAPYVLAPFEAEEREPVDKAILLAAQAAALWSFKGMPACQRRANVKVKPPRPPREEAPAAEERPSGSPESGTTPPAPGPSSIPGRTLVLEPTAAPGRGPGPDAEGGEPGD